MANDPVSAVSSWLVSPSDVVEDDPVLVLIAEEKRLQALWVAATERGDELLAAMPEDIRNGRVRVSFGGERRRYIFDLRNSFTSEADLQEYLDIWRKLPRRIAERDGESPDAADADFDREIGVDQVLDQLRAGLEEIRAIREASGCEAFYREARALESQAEAIHDRLCQTKPVTLAGAIAMLELGLEGGDYDEPLAEVAIAGLRDMQAKGTLHEKPDVIGFGEPEGGGAA